jgi:hypothetical protein
VHHEDDRDHLESGIDRQQFEPVYGGGYEQEKHRAR